MTYYTPNSESEVVVEEFFYDEAGNLTKKVVTTTKYRTNPGNPYVYPPTIGWPWYTTGISTTTDKIKINTYNDTKTS